jgi:hypothetical protein
MWEKISLAGSEEKHVTCVYKLLVRTAESFRGVKKALYSQESNLTIHDELSAKVGDGD